MAGVWTLRHDRTKARNLRGLGGWLLIFVLVVIGGLIIDAHGLYVSRHAVLMEMRALPRLSRVRAPHFVLLALARHVVVAVVIVLRVIGLWLIARRSRRAAAYWTLVSAVLMPLQLYHATMGAWERRAAARIGMRGYASVPYGLVALVGALTAAIWCGYWLCSRRVLATFGRRGLDLFSDQPGPPAPTRS